MGGGGSAPRVLPVAGSAASESQTGGAGFSRLVQKETAHQGDPRRSNTPFGISNIASFFSSEGPETSAGGRGGRYLQRWETRAEVETVIFRSAAVLRVITSIMACGRWPVFRCATQNARGGNNMRGRRDSATGLGSRAWPIWDTSRCG